MNWHTCWNAVRKHAETSIDIKKRASGVKAIGVDEHIWRPSRISSADNAYTPFGVRWFGTLPPWTGR